MINETKNDFLNDLALGEAYSTPSLDLLTAGESRYIKDLRINAKNVLKSQHLSAKEALLIAVSIVANNHHDVLLNTYTEKAKAAEATDAEIAEAVACASLLAANNVFYRFRHFMNKEKYNQLPARIKMNIMMNPVTGKEFFELMSLAVSAVNGCEMCVQSHEASLINLGATEERIFDAVKIASVITSLCKVV
ncbi:MAG: carboxymuconolactone decarboxylase family protein [Flammeovirgaceae bacterium]